MTHQGGGLDSWGKVNIEKEILRIYLTCRSDEEISQKFDELINGNSEERQQKFSEAKEIILKDFDEEVQNKLKSLDLEIKAEIDKKGMIARDVILSCLPEHKFKSENNIFVAGCNDFGLLPEKEYFFLRQDTVELITPRHPVFDQVKKSDKKSSKIIFKYSGNHSISMVENIVGESGKFAVFKATLTGLEVKEVLLPIFITNNRKLLDKEVGDKLLGVTSEEVANLNDVVNPEEFKAI